MTVTCCISDPFLASLDSMMDLLKGELTDYSFDGRGGQCNICSPTIHFTSAKNAIAHVMGHKHQISLGYRSGVRALGPDYIIHQQAKLQQEQGCLRKSPKHGRRLPSQEAYLSDDSDSTISGDSMFSSRREKNDNTKWMFCDICNCRVNSDGQVQVHNMGKKHRQRVEALQSININSRLQVRPFGSSTVQPPSPSALRVPQHHVDAATRTPFPAQSMITKVPYTTQCTTAFHNQVANPCTSLEEQQLNILAEKLAGLPVNNFLGQSSTIHNPPAFTLNTGVCCG